MPFSQERRKWPCLKCFAVTVVSYFPPAQDTKINGFVENKSVKEPGKQPGNVTKYRQIRITGSTRSWAGSSGQKSIPATGSNTAKDILTKQKGTVSFKPSVTAGPGHRH
jgi:hypothetical protein